MRIFIKIYGQKFYQVHIDILMKINIPLLSGREKIKLLTSPKGSIIINVTCERGGTGRRTGFRILRLVHKGSSPFARTMLTAKQKMLCGLLYFVKVASDK